MPDELAASAAPRPAIAEDLTHEPYGLPAYLVPPGYSPNREPAQEIAADRAAPLEKRSRAFKAPAAELAPEALHRAALDCRVKSVFYDREMLTLLVIGLRHPRRVAGADEN